MTVTKILAEWTQNGENHRGEFNSWAEYYAAATAQDANASLVRACVIAGVSARGTTQTNVRTPAKALLGELQKGSALRRQMYIRLDSTRRTTEN